MTWILFDSVTDVNLSLERKTEVSECALKKGCTYATSTSWTSYGGNLTKFSSVTLPPTQRHFFFRYLTFHFNLYLPLFYSQEQSISIKTVMPFEVSLSLTNLKVGTHSVYQKRLNPGFTLACDWAFAIMRMTVDISWSLHDKRFTICSVLPHGLKEHQSTARISMNTHLELRRSTDFNSKHLFVTRSARSDIVMFHDVIFNALEIAYFSTWPLWRHI